MEQAARPLNLDETLVDENANAQIMLEDWSGLGRGFHVDFDDDEKVPLEPAKFLGRGAMGDVHETVAQGVRVAHKRIYFRRRIYSQDKKEVEIMKKMSHIHILQLVGTHTQQRVLGLLLYPVAICDLHTFFDDVEALNTERAGSDDLVPPKIPMEPAQRKRLQALDYDFPGPRSNLGYANLVYSKIGCIISAVAYLHGQKIRHKDLKPQNILLSKDNIWLSDFGSATDFSLLSQSATDFSRGTPRYFAPEVNELQPNGRAADIFSLGCVFLEILVLNTHGTLHQIRDTRPNKSCFHANLNKIGLWLEHPQLSICPQASWLRNEVRRMMAREPGQRPDIKTILKKAAASELVRNNAAVDTIFGACCKTELMSRDSHEIAVATLHEAHFEQCQEYDQRLEAKDIERIEASKRSAMMLVELERRLHRAQKTIVILKSESANAQGGRRAASQGSSSDDNRSAHTTFDDHETPEEQCPEQEYQDRDGSMHRPLAKGPFDR